MSHPCGRRMAGQLEALAGVADLGAFDLEDRDIAVDKIADIHVRAVRRESDRLGQAAAQTLRPCRHLNQSPVGALPSVQFPAEGEGIPLPTSDQLSVARIVASKRKYARDKDN